MSQKQAEMRVLKNAGKKEIPLAPLLKGLLHIGKPKKRGKKAKARRKSVIAALKG